MPLYVASIQSPKEPVTGWVTTMEDLTVAIVCHHVDGEWAPQYGIKVNPDRTHRRVPLPSCFALDDQAVFCLDNALMECDNA